MTPSWWGWEHDILLNVQETMVYHDFYRPNSRESCIVISLQARPGVWLGKIPGWPTWVSTSNRCWTKGWHQLHMLRRLVMVSLGPSLTLGWLKTQACTGTDRYSTECFGGFSVLPGNSRTFRYSSYFQIHCESLRPHLEFYLGLHLDVLFAGTQYTEDRSNHNLEVINSHWFP